MPLLDHFHPPLSERRHWHSFHNSWATYISSQLNALLPEGYFAEANVQYGIEIDVAAFEEAAVGVPAAGWTAPPPQTSVPLEFPGAGATNSSRSDTRTVSTSSSRPRRSTTARSAS